MRVAVIGLGYVGLPLARRAATLDPARGRLVAHITNMWRDVVLPDELKLWTL